jgi:hypothetical protein
VHAIVRQYDGATTKDEQIQFFGRWIQNVPEIIFEGFDLTRHGVQK